MEMRVMKSMSKVTGLLREVLRLKPIQPEPTIWTLNHLTVSVA